MYTYSEILRAKAPNGLRGEKYTLSPPYPGLNHPLGVGWTAGKGLSVCMVAEWITENSCKVRTQRFAGASVGLVPSLHHCCCTHNR